MVVRRVTRACRVHINQPAGKQIVQRVPLGNISILLVTTKNKTAMHVLPIRAITLLEVRSRQVANAIVGLLVPMAALYVHCVRGVNIKQILDKLPVPNACRENISTVLVMTKNATARHVRPIQAITLPEAPSKQVANAIVGPSASMAAPRAHCVCRVNTRPLWDSPFVLNACRGNISTRQVTTKNEIARHVRPIRAITLLEVHSRQVASAIVGHLVPMAALHVHCARRVDIKQIVDKLLVPNACRENILTVLVMTKNTTAKRVQPIQEITLPEVQSKQVASAIVGPSASMAGPRVRCVYRVSIKQILGKSNVPNACRENISTPWVVTKNAIAKHVQPIQAITLLGVPP